MIPKKINEINLEDLHLLVTERVHESKTIDFKAEFYKLDHKEQKAKDAQCEEMLKDISAFANTLGGDLVYGVEEEKGIASRVGGFECENIDSLKQMVIQIVERGLEPRLRIDIHQVEIEAGKYAVVIRVMRSHLAPHRIVRANPFGRFWERNSSGCNEMDTNALRREFTLWSSTYERMRNFRRGRIEALHTGTYPFAPRACLVCHLMPVQAFASNYVVPQHHLNEFTQSRPLPNSSIHLQRFFNFEGVQLRTSAEYSNGFVQIHRNGAIEFVAADFTVTHAGRLYFRKHYLHTLISTLDYYTHFLSRLGFSPPAWCAVTLTGVLGAELNQGSSYFREAKFDRDIVECPEVELFSFDGLSKSNVLQAPMDLIWNCLQLERCEFFDDQGKLLPLPRD